VNIPSSPGRVMLVTGCFTYTASVGELNVSNKLLRISDPGFPVAALRKREKRNNPPVMVRL
jgi:hypothetical protein